MASVEVAAPPATVMTKPDNSPVPRKRRRRTTASGAADDCFACRKREVQCDRKRPYCSQCLEIGKECSGYKTTLTWGVGVASRGKLRGLSLPVVDKATTAPNQSRKGSTSTKRKASTTSNTSAPAQSWSAQPLPTTAFTFSIPPVPEIKLEGVHEKQHMAQMAPPTWQHIEYNGRQRERSRGSNSAAPHSNTLPPLQIPIPAGSMGNDSGYPTSATSMAFSEHSFSSPTSFGPPQTPFQQPQTSIPASQHFPAFPYQEASTMPSIIQNSQTQYQKLPAPPQEPAGMAELSNSNLSESIFDASDMQVSSTNPASSFFDSFELSLDAMLDGQEDAANDVDLSLALPRSFGTTPFFHLSPRMQSLLDFYDKHICSVLVAFDGQSNPYRKHILQLAGSSEGLQNAIAALATNNIRMRSQRQLQAAGLVEELGDDESAMAMRSSISAPTPEETCYKTLSIEQLNMQLAHPSGAQDDSVLATLLILCLFHVADSGFSKFKTQLAGVQKLLSFRGKAAQSGFIGWVQMFFTWFDVMTSTVNDRETEIKGDSLDMLDYSSNLGALEQFSGCDGRLFKLIARLGRLNLLSQDRPVRANDDGKPTASRPSFPGFYFRRGTFDAADFSRLDGNGWGSTISELDEDDNAFQDNIGKQANGSSDTRHEFWKEWHDIRSRLQSWSMDYSSIPSPTTSTPPDLSTQYPSTPLGPEQRDLVHINESFRSSALLYTERLAHPLLPSSAPNFQNLVAQALFHITALSVTSCVNKFLLWPLFIIGTECVDPCHRETVRQRCVEIQRESGFFNNISVLEVLERVWRETEGFDVVDGAVGAVEGEGEGEEIRRRRRDSRGSGRRQWGQAFRWRRAMDRADGEYIVV